MLVDVVYRFPLPYGRLDHHKCWQDVDCVIFFVVDKESIALSPMW